MVATIDAETQSVEFSWEYNNSRNDVPAFSFVLAIKQEEQDVITTTLSINERSYSVSLSRLRSEETYIVDVAVRNLQGDSEPVSQIFTVPRSSGVGKQVNIVRLRVHSKALCRDVSCDCALNYYIEPWTNIIVSTCISRSSKKKKTN